MHQAILHFPEVQLQQRDGHKLRGYFSQLFGQESDLWHNHQTDGKVIYRYPRIQYKVIGGAPMLVGVAEGAQLLIDRFFQIKELKIKDQQIPVHQKNLQSKDVPIGIADQLFSYRFVTPWQALNQENYPAFPKEYKAQKGELERLLRGNILSFLKGVNHFEENRILTTIHAFRQVPIKMKNQNLMGFLASFTTNMQLPEYIGLGKSSSRGFGAIRLAEPAT